MPSKKKPAKKAAVKKKAVKKSAAKKAVKKPAAKKQPAAKKKPAAKKQPARKLAEGVTMVEVVQITSIDPVNLGVEIDVSGMPQVFYGTTEIETEINDVFESTTGLTSVDWIVKNNAASSVDVTFGSGSPITLRPTDSTTYNMSMPAAGACNSTNLTVETPGFKHDPVIKIKRKGSNGQIPNC